MESFYNIHDWNLLNYIYKLHLQVSTNSDPMFMLRKPDPPMP